MSKVSNILKIDVKKEDEISTINAKLRSISTKKSYFPQMFIAF